MVTLLEAALPSYDFEERHTRVIRTSPERVWTALESITLEQLRISRPLIAIRYAGRDRPAGRSLLREGPAQLLETLAPRYAVAGAIAQPWRWRAPHRPIESLEAFRLFREPGWVKYLTDFHIVVCDQGVQLTTVTRGVSTDDHARRMFHAYWAAIRPASGVIRRDVLATVARLARDAQ